MKSDVLYKSGNCKGRKSTRYEVLGNRFLSRIIAFVNNTDRYISENDIVIDQIISYMFVSYWRNGVCTVGHTSIFVDPKKAYDSVGGQLLYSKFVEFDPSVKVEGLIKVILTNCNSQWHIIIHFIVVLNTVHCLELFKGNVREIQSLSFIGCKIMN